jgi:prolyl-tRNA synthetase
VPIYKNDEELNLIRQRVRELTEKLRILNISFKFDDRDTQRPGYKFAEWELKGVPIRLAIGPKDYQNNTWEVARRDTLTKEFITNENIIEHIKFLLEDIQQNIYNNALKFREENTHKADTWEEFKQILDEKGGFVLAHWDGTKETEEKIKEETKATIRLIPLNPEIEEGKCIYTGKKSNFRVVFARSY